jgi:predicted nucleic acid-binding protein
VERWQADWTPSQATIDGPACIAHGHRGQAVTLYLDTSSLVKLYVEEDDSNVIERLVNAATVVATSVVAYAEARAVFARRRREGLLTAGACAAVTRRFDADWSALFVIEVTQTLGRSAGALADRFGLRGFDAIHLASFEMLLGRAEDDDAQFSSADIRLTRTAKRLG